MWRSLCVFATHSWSYVYGPGFQGLHYQLRSPIPQIWKLKMLYAIYNIRSLVVYFRSGQQWSRRATSMEAWMQKKCATTFWSASSARAASALCHLLFPRLPSCWNMKATLMPFHSGNPEHSGGLLFVSLSLHTLVTDKNRREVHNINFGILSIRTLARYYFFANSRSKRSNWQLFGYR